MRPERFTAWILATALCAAAPAVQGAPDAATRTSAATALSLQDARTRLLQVSDQLAAARAAVESKRLQTQGLQGLGGPIVGLSASHTRYSLHGELDLAEAKQEISNRLSELGPLLPALGIARNVLDNRVLANDVDAAAEEVKNGIGLSAALGKGKRFPRLALQMIQVGEESGALDAMLLKTADTFEQETSIALDRMLAALVPAVTLVLATIVGIVILAVLSPIYDLTSVIG